MAAWDVRVMFDITVEAGTPEEAIAVAEQTVVDGVASHEIHSEVMD